MINIQLGNDLIEFAEMKVKERIIIIDDNEDTCFSLSLTLKDEGYETEVAMTGQKGLNKIINKFYNIVLLDINLPDIKGTELLTSIKEIHPNMDIIMITANPSANLVIEALNKGASGYILKPFTKDNLLSNIKDKIERQHLIAEKRQAKQRLYDERDRLINILNSMQDGIYIVNQRHEIEFCNPALMKEFGPVEGRKCYEYFHDHQEECPWCKNQVVFEGKTVRWEWYSFKNQKTYDLLDTPLKNSDGTISKLEIFRDITEQKNLLIKLKESEISLRKSKLELEIKNQISNVFLTVPDEQMYGEVLSIILKTLKSEFGIFGYLDENENLVEPSLTEDVWEKCAIEDKRIVFSKKLWAKNIYGRIINEKNSLYVNKFFNVPEGHIPISNFLGSPIIYNNKVIGIFIVSNKESDYEEHDVKLLESISDLIAPILAVRLERDRIEKIRQRAEHYLKESEEKYREAYERANFYKSLFAHDIRNILQSISSSEQIFSLFLNNPNKLKKREKLLEIIRRQVNRGNILISNVQKLSQLEEIGISLKKVKVQEALDESINFLNRSFPEKEIDITLDMPDKDYEVFANELLLDAFENIMLNSVKHNDNPSIEIDIRVSEDQWEESNCVKLEFIDNGRGISATKKEKIFHKGPQKDILSEGMGIGLSLVKKIIENYNGYILVENKVKGDYTKGTNFIILIPKVKEN